MQECASLVRKLNQDKKDRETRIQEIQKRNEDKLNAEMEERMKIM